MMILENATIIDAVTGRVKFMFKHVPEELVQDNLGEGSLYITEAAPSADCYWDFDALAFVAPPEQPSTAHLFDYLTKRWYDPRTLADHKAQKWSELKAQRNALEFGGFEFEGHTYDSDQTSQGRIMGAVMSQTGQVWTVADNTTVSLTAAQVASLYVTLQIHVANAHARGRIARQALDAATTVEEIDAIIF